MKVQRQYFIITLFSEAVLHACMYENQKGVQSFTVVSPYRLTWVDSTRSRLAGYINLEIRLNNATIFRLYKITTELLKSRW